MKLKNKKISIVQIIRFVMQLLFLLLLPGLFINAFAGIRQIYTEVLDHSFNLVDSLPQLIELAAIIPCTLLMGRFFCGWMCAFGTICDILYQISTKLFKISFRVNKKSDQILKYAKYVVLVTIIIFWSSGIKAPISANPWDAFGALFSFAQLPDFSYIFTEYTAGLFIMLAVLTASMFIERFFCRYLCPLGAFFSIVSGLRLTRINKPSEKCGNCNICSKTCSMGIKLSNLEKTASAECIDCLKCISDCPRKNVSISCIGERLKPVTAGIIAVALITITFLLGSLLAENSIRNSSPYTDVSNAASNNSGSYADGTFEGSGTGFRGRTTTVSVTISNGAISDIQVISYGDDERWFSRAFNFISGEILNKQSAEVDAVSGATYSSNGIMEAVNDALRKSTVQKGNEIDK